MKNATAIAILLAAIAAMAGDQYDYLVSNGKTECARKQTEYNEVAKGVWYRARTVKVTQVWDNSCGWVCRR